MDLVIGVGNTLRTDDGIGPRVVSSLPPLHGVKTITVHQLTPELSDRLSRARRVLFVDADWEGGEMHLERVDEERTAPGHTFSPGGLLSLTHAVCGATPEGWLLAIPGYDFDLGERVSEEAEALLPPATKAILDWVKEGEKMNPVSNGGICIGHERRGGMH
ncbi:MAG: hydrogenase maturation protease [Candidatus Bipolaricaulota bacterium]|nr:hydrogenase maturation protease [Candidatus Bipolaricaulota bacterium]